MRVLLLTGMAAAALLAACADTGTDLGLRGGVQVSFATRSAALGGSAQGVSAAALDDTLSDGQGNELIIERVEMVLREIELERAEGACNDDAPGCEDVEFGPILVDLPLDPGAAQRLAVEVPPGTYEEIEFEIHKPDDDDAADLAFLAEHPDFKDVSIRVRGTWNGLPFTYETDLNAEQELDFVPPLVVDEQTVVNITIFVKVDTWFRDANGDLVDPSTANKGEPNENLVRDNIIRSIEAFEDDDGDGSPNG